jgi:hypothetical protein
MRIAALFVLLAALTCAPALAQSPAQAQPPRDYDRAIARVYPLPIELTGEVRTASRGDALFVQPTEIRDVVRLQGPVEVVQTVGNGGHRISSPAGAELYRVALEFRTEAHAYCAGEIMLTARRVVPDAARVCFTDEDRDNAFETAWWMDIAIGGQGDGVAFQLDPVLRMGGGQIHGLFAPLSPPVRYEASSPHSIAPLSLGVEFVFAAGGTTYFELVGVEGDNTHVPIDSAQIWVTSTPTTIRILGSEIEIVSFNDESDTVTYRVISALPLGQGVTLAPPLPPMSEPPAITNPRWIERPTAADYERYWPRTAWQQEIEGWGALDCIVNAEGR